MPKNFVGEPFCVSLFSGTEKVWIREGRSIKIFRRFFLSHIAEKFRSGTFQCFTIFGYRKKLDNRGGVSKISVEFFCLTVLKIPVGESFTVAKISGIKKVWIREGGGSEFSVKKFLCHSAENFRRRHVYWCNKFGCRKVWIREGGVSRLSVENFLSHSAESFRRGVLYCCDNSGYRKSLDKRGGGEYQDVLSKFFCLTVPKHFAGEPFSVSLISGIKKVRIRGRGSIKIFRRKFLVSQCRKTL